jgi:ABC-type nitrate/sulfonate/bicarbonate transport system substrate-binding protein
MVGPWKRHIRLGGIGTVLLTALIGCGGGSGTTPTGSGGGGTPKSSITIGIDIPFHPIFDYLEAKSDQYFAGKPYTVSWKVLDATTQVPAFGAGQLDVMTTPPSFIPRVKDSYGIDAAEFFPLARWSIGPQLLVPVDSPYSSIKDMQGKHVAIKPLNGLFGSEEAAVLAQTHQNIRNYFNLEQTDAAAQELTLGRVDGTIIEAPSTYPLLQSGKFKAIWSVHDAFWQAFGDPAVVNGGFIATRSFIQNNPQFIKDLVAAAQDVWNKYQADPSSVNTVASQISGIPAAQLAVVGQVLDLANMPASERRISPQDVNTWKQIFPLLAQSGFIKNAPADVAQLFVVSP